ncbi:MAG: glycoside hydrolase family 5 protein [Saccharofermentans sp.]|nr:glycoside hydrolase family 5 protein [Saccharofermentans sp.]
MTDFTGFKHGVNLGGWLSQCDHTTKRYDEFVTRKDIEVIKGWGLDHVRVPVDYELVEENDGSYKEKGFVYIDNVISWCREYGLNMILDLHRTFGYSFYDGDNEHGFFDSEEYQERFYKLWEKFAERYGKNSDMLAFELLNEVTKKEYCDTWNDISYKCIEKIRKYAPDIKILVGGYYNNSVEAVKDIAMPYDENIVYNFHCYEPLIFTHQGAPWIPTMDTSYRISVKASYKEMDEGSRNNIEQVTTGFAGYSEDAVLDEQYFEDIFAEAIEVAKQRGVSLYCGEYGVIDRAAPEEALSWYKIIGNVFNKFDIGRAAWNYKEMDFGLSDKRMDDVREDLIKYL